MNFRKIIIFLIVIFIFLILLWKVELFNVKKIEVEKNNDKCLEKQNILSEFNLKNKNIFLINEEEINKNILKKYICIKKVYLEKKFPSTIKIIINERKGLARVVNYKKQNLLSFKDLEATASSQTALLNWSFLNSSESGNFIVDDEGLIFDQNVENNLPIIFIPEQILEIGKKINNIDFSKVALLLNKLVQMNIYVTQTQITEKNLQMKNEQKLVFSLEKDILKQIASLHLILDKAKIDDTTMEIIDLRFDRPVVKYVPKK